MNQKLIMTISYRPSHRFARIKCRMSMKYRARFKIIATTRLMIQRYTLV